MQIETDAILAVNNSDLSFRYGVNFVAKPWNCDCKRHSALKRLVEGVKNRGKEISVDQVLIYLNNCCLLQKSVNKNGNCDFYSVIVYSINF